MAKDEHEGPGEDTPGEGPATRSATRPAAGGLDTALGRRELLERTGAAFGLITAAGCIGSDEGNGEGVSADATDPSTAGTAAPPAPGQPPADSQMGAATDPGGAPSPPGDASAGAAGGSAPRPAGDNDPPGDASGDGMDGPTGGQPPGDGSQMSSDPPGDGSMMPPDPPGDGSLGDPAGDGPPAQPTSGVPVSFVKRDDLDEAVALAVTLAGGIDEIQAGQTVFIKPNAVSNRAIQTPGIRTSNEVLAAVVRLVKAKNPGRIIVGDRSARGFDSMQVFDSTGMGEAALAAGADEIYAAPESGRGEDDHWMLSQPTAYEEVWESAGGILVMRKIVEADHLINVPTCKNHRYALFSLSLKNFVGGIGDSSRDPLHYLSSIGSDFEPLGRDIALLNQPFSPLINVIDATTVLVNGGPQGDGADAVRVSAGLILAGKDRVALDTAGVALIKHELSRTQVSMADSSQSDLTSGGVWAFPQIENAIELGLGVASAAEASLVFDGVDPDDAAAIEQIWQA